MTRNIGLKQALVGRGVPDYRSAYDANLNPTKLSKIIIGLVIPTQDEKKRLAEVLKRPVDELFPESNPNPQVVV